MSALMERFALALLAATQRHRTRQRLRRLIAVERKRVGAFSW
jgi:hypothetical protein